VKLPSRRGLVCGEDGIAVFDRLHRRQKVTDAMLYAFDLLELNGADLQSLPLGDRKARLAKLLARPRAVRQGKVRNIFR
jgi:ATP-dependent DNA ligase